VEWGFEFGRMADYHEERGMTSDSDYGMAAIETAGRREKGDFDEK